MLYRFFCLLLLLFTQVLIAADVYYWTDTKGRSHFSDKKQESATAYQLKESFSYHIVRKVYDGDTVLLNDGRKVRLLGINTPEIAHLNRVSQPGGDAARKWLTQQILGTQVRLEFDQQKRDKYKRYLAHLFTKQNVHINRELVRLGFASTNVFPPNLKYIDDLVAAEQAAEESLLGIWGDPAYQIKLTGELNKNNKQGWQRVAGKVTAINNTFKSTYLKLGHSFSVRIKKDHLQYFQDLEDVKGRNIEVRGWINRYKNGFSMLVKHPSAIKVIY